MWYGKCGNWILTGHFWPNFSPKLELIHMTIAGKQENVYSAGIYGHQTVVKLINLICCFPSILAVPVCEQGISRIKYAKTDQRNEQVLAVTMTRL